MSSPPSVSIADDFSASQTSIACGSTDNECSTRIQDVFGILKEVLRDGMLDDMLDEIGFDFSLLKSRVVLA